MIARSGPLADDLDPVARAAASWIPSPGARLGAATWKQVDFDRVAPFLDEAAFVSLWSGRADIDGVIGWGLKIGGRLGRLVAAARGLPYWCLEDGFLRSLGLGKAGAAAWSIVVDDLGLFIDARRPSRLERILAGADLEPLRGRAEALGQAIVAGRLSKYNHAPDTPVSIAGRGRRILLVDQVWGDWSVPAAGADAAVFERMFREACAVGGATVVVRVHPDVAAGYRKGFLGLERRTADGHVQVLDAVTSPHAILDAVDEVWTVSSQFGFDALLRGVQVVCYGTPFYAGWGLTDDRATTPVADAARARRSAVRSLTLPDLVAGALLLYARYRDPTTGGRIDAETAVARMTRALRA
ncbi:hypothetical protein [Mongoliimonas terrestris]|uniref:capsular polysaccharide export protein, LipB/KpsS family n=1 Tax=Mongoliimonas terrestris TaxID=1709001 RepID=UPI0009496C75|nr:hypothetical protein [Mongoliimonas terrestris]